MPTDYQREWEPRLREALEGHDCADLAELLAEVHAPDLADWFIELDESEQITVLNALSDEQAAELLDELDPGERSDMLNLLPVDRASDIVEEMPSDEAADLLGELSTEDADALLERMEPEAAKEVEELMRYPDHSAGGLMAKEFVQVAPDQTVADVLALLRRHHDHAEMVYYLYVLEDESRLLGIVNLRKLIVSEPAATMAEIMAREFVSVPPDMPQEEVAEIVRRRDLLAVPVLDEDGRLLGIVTVDDIGDVVQEEAAVDLLEMGGSEETPTMPLIPWASRRGWRSGLLALIGSVISAGLIATFARTLSDWSHVATYLPLLLLLGITGSSQAALSMDNAYDSAVERHQLWRIFVREMWAGAALAAVGGLLGGLLALILHRAASPGIAVMIPTAFGLWVALVMSVLGVIVLRRWGGRLGPLSHTAILVVALVAAITLYLLAAGWTAPLAPR
ncbi:MAG: magnesium transporter [Armatimonadota bacterium]